MLVALQAKAGSSSSIDFDRARDSEGTLCAHPGASEGWRGRNLKWGLWRRSGELFAFQVLQSCLCQLRKDRATVMPNVGFEGSLICGILYKYPSALGLGDGWSR